jgi:hypothetical protein
VLGDSDLARTTSGAVQAILLQDYDSLDNPDLTPFIETASSVVDDVSLCASQKGTPLATAKLELLERWLSAHCYCLVDRLYYSRKTGKAEGIFQGRTGMNLDYTPYGQMAKSLDPTGCLVAVTSSMKAGMMWLGKTLPEQINYDQRN